MRRGNRIGIATSASAPERSALRRQIGGTFKGQRLMWRRQWGVPDNPADVPVRQQNQSGKNPCVSQQRDGLSRSGLTALVQIQ